MKFSVELRAQRAGDELPDIVQIVEAQSGTEAAALALRPDYAVRLVTAAPASPPTPAAAPTITPVSSKAMPARATARAPGAAIRATSRKAVRS